MGTEIPKQFLRLADVPVLVHTLRAVQSVEWPMGVVVVLPAAHIATWREICEEFGVPKHTVVEGGASRFDSVKAGLAALPEEARLVAVHDGVRPFVSAELIGRCFDAASEHGSAIPVVAPVDSFRRVTSEGSEIVDRSELRAVQTPQVFAAERLRAVYAAYADGSMFTDDASVVESCGWRVWLVDGERTNFKITTPTDLVTGLAILGQFDKK
jgi:2-C-methyl-D-erythritol 4-phosphate cytidylyltransferase